MFVEYGKNKGQFYIIVPVKVRDEVLVVPVIIWLDNLRGPFKLGRTGRAITESVEYKSHEVHIPGDHYEPLGRIEIRNTKKLREGVKKDVYKNLYGDVAYSDRKAKLAHGLLEVL